MGDPTDGVTEVGRLTEEDKGRGRGLGRRGRFRSSHPRRRMAAACDVLRSAREELADLRLESGGRLGARDAEARAGAAGAASRESSATCVRVVVPRTRETLGVPELDTGALDDDTLFAIGRRVGAGGARSVVVVETPGPLWSDVAAQLAEPSTARLRRATVRQLGLNGRVLESSSLAAPAWTGCRRERGAPRRHGQVWATTLVRGRRWRSVPGRHAASRRPYDLVVVLLGPHYASVGMGWWDRVASVLHRHAALVSVNAWISTLGGGFFLCQDTESARALALAQLLVVERFQDPGLARRVQLHLVYVDAQEGQLDAARARLAHLVAECPADEVRSKGTGERTEC